MIRHMTLTPQRQHDIDTLISEITPAILVGLESLLSDGALAVPVGEMNAFLESVFDRSNIEHQVKIVLDKSSSLEEIRYFVKSFAQIVFSNKLCKVFVVEHDAPTISELN